MVPAIDATGLDTSDALTKQGGTVAPRRSRKMRTTMRSAKRTSHALTSASSCSFISRPSSRARNYLNTADQAGHGIARIALAQRALYSAASISRMSYRGRSKTFRPKTRSAVRKMLAAAAKALFGTGDVVSITAENDSDPGRNLRVPEARAHQLPSIAPRKAQRHPVVHDRNGRARIPPSPASAFRSSNGSTRKSSSTTAMGGNAPKSRSIAPTFKLFPSENVLFDPNCDWTAPAQSSAYLILKYPMNIGDARQLIKSNNDRARASRGVTYRTKSSARPSIQHRRHGNDRHALGAQRRQRPRREATGDFAPCWLREFMRFEGQELVFWTINDTS
jgi:hypothetical protein